MADQQLSLFEKIKSFKSKNKNPLKKSLKRQSGDEAENLAYSFLQKQG